MDGQMGKWERGRERVGEEGREGRLIWMNSRQGCIQQAMNTAYLLGWE